MYYNAASHILFSILFHTIDSYLKRYFDLSGLALSPFMIEKLDTTNQYIVVSFYKSVASENNFRIIISTSTPSVHHCILQYLNDNSSAIALRLSLIVKHKLNITFTSNHFLWKRENEVPNIVIKSSIIDAGDRNSNNTFSIYCENDFFKLFKINMDTSHRPINTYELESQFLHFFKDPYTLFPSLPFILEVMSDDEFQKLIYYLLNEKLLTPYHLFLISRAYPQYSLKIKHNISRHTISDIINVGKSIHKITYRDVLEAIYAFEELLFLKLRSKPYFHYGTFIEQVHSILHHMRMVTLFQQKAFDEWVYEFIKSNLLYAVLAKCDDITIAAAFYNSRHLISLLNNYISSKRINSITSLFEMRCDISQIISSQHRMIELFLNKTSSHNKLYSLPFNIVLKKYMTPENMYYVLFEIGWFVIATALKQSPKKLCLECIKHFPEGARYCIIDVYNGVLNPNIVHDEMQIKKARNQLIQSILKLNMYGIIHFQE